MFLNTRSRIFSKIRIIWVPWGRIHIQLLNVVRRRLFGAAFTTGKSTMQHGIIGRSPGIRTTQCTQ